MSSPAAAAPQDRRAVPSFHRSGNCLTANPRPVALMAPRIRTRPEKRFSAALLFLWDSCSLGESFMHRITKLLPVPWTTHQSESGTHTHTLPTSTTNHTPSRALLPLILIGVQDTTGTPYTHDMEMEHTNALHYTTVQRHYRYASSTEQTTDIPIRPPPRRRSYRPKSPNLSLRTSLLLFLATGFRLQLLLRILVVVFFFLEPYTVQPDFCRACSRACGVPSWWWSWWTRSPSWNPSCPSSTRRLHSITISHGFFFSFNHALKEASKQ